MNTSHRCRFGLVVCLLWAVVSIVADAAFGRTLLEASGSTQWKFLDTGVAPPPAWIQPTYDDSKWQSGKAPLGYGEPRVATELRSSNDEGKQPVTAWFRCKFDVPKLRPGESLVLMSCIDDGAIFYLNGREIDRINMPSGKVMPTTLAASTVSDKDEGLYTRQHIPAHAVKAGKNVLAIEVHQGGIKSSDLFLDVAVKVLPPEAGVATVTSDAQQVITLFNKGHYLGPEVKVPDGYIDGGRGMKIDGGGQASSGREILTVDRAHDAELAADLTFARSSEIRMLPELDRIQRISALIDKRTTPPGGREWVGETTTLLEKEFENKPVLIGDWVDQCQAGVCRHRALLFKILGDEAGLKTSLVRGNFAKNGPPGGAHAWNEVQLADGRRILVDVMHQGGKPKFLDITSPEVVARYLKVDDTPWYKTEAE
jgi:hypothetical protein